MSPVICNNVQRDNEGRPLYTVKVYDLDYPVTANSYNCIFIKQAHNMEQLISEATNAIIHYGEKPIEEKEDEK